MAEPGPKTKFETSKYGWGVIRREPWHLDQVFDTEEEAKARALELGPEYGAQPGEKPAGSDDFIWSATKAG